MPHRGHKKAVIAVAHAMLVTAYHLLARQTTYHDPGADYYERRHADRSANEPSSSWNAKATASPRTRSMSARRYQRGFSEQTVSGRFGDRRSSSDGPETSEER